jgi:hypothetical protein
MVLISYFVFLVSPSFIGGSYLDLLRRERWILAEVLGSLATAVRPFGIFALLGLEFICCIASGFAIVP